VRTVVPCPDCGAPVPIPMVQIVKGDGADISEIFCRNCMWTGGDEIFKSGGRYALVVWGGEEIVADTRHPYVFVPVTEAASLNSRINALTNGGTIWLEQGNYAAAGDITVSNSNVVIRGVGMSSTILGGSVLIEAGVVRLQDLAVRATGKAYGVKLYTSSGAGTPRCEIRNVWIGASSVGAGNGPDKGLWLDGAILTVVDHCTIAFNNHSGLYVNTSDTVAPIASTNMNTFRDCTFNGNGRYGVEIEVGVDAVAGMMGHRFVGGNMESNTLGEFSADNATFIAIQGVDFECGIDHTGGQIISISASQPVLIEDCNFVISQPNPPGTAVAVTRFFLITNCGDAHVRRCRLSTDGVATWVQGAVGVFTEGCTGCTEQDNILSPAGAGRYISNRGRMRT